MTIEKIRNDELSRYLSTAEPVNSGSESCEPIKRSGLHEKKTGVKPILWKNAKEQYDSTDARADCLRLQFAKEEIYTAQLFLHGLRAMKPSFALVLCPDDIDAGCEAFVRKMAKECSAFSARAYTRGGMITIMLAPLSERVGNLFDPERVMKIVAERQEKCA